MRRVLLVLFAACNAIDGVDQYRVADASSDTSSVDSGNADAGSCPQSCVQNAMSCLEACASTEATCLNTCGNPGHCKMCQDAFTMCSMPCTMMCMQCGASCTPMDCTPPIPDASAD